MTKVSAADELVALAEVRYTFGCSIAGHPYAKLVDQPHIAVPLRGGLRSLRQELAAAFADEYGKVPNTSALADAMAVLEGRALAARRRTALHLRVAPDDSGGHVVDLGDEEGRVVVVTRDGWRVADNADQVFYRTRLTGALPVPAVKGDLAVLRDLLNVTTEMFTLVAGYLVAMLHVGIPHPVLAVWGPQGTGKSWLTRRLVEVLDPSPAPLRSVPRDLTNWVVAAAGSYVVALDNVSDIRSWLSDAICRAVTGDGLVRRSLFTDDDVSVIAFRRVVILNGIAIASLRGDLADRVVQLVLPPISDRRRRLDADLDAEWLQTHPVVLGGLLDLAVQVLRVLPDVQLAGYPRMADYVKILGAVDKVLGTNALDLYLGQRAMLAADVVDSDVVAAAVRDFAGREPWTGTAGELLDRLRPKRPGPNWPTTPKGMAVALDRVAPSLRADNVEVIRLGASGHNNRRLWRVSRVMTAEEQAEPAFAPFARAADLHSTSDEAASDARAVESADRAPLANDRSHETTTPHVSDPPGAAASGASRASGLPPRLSDEAVDPYRCLECGTEVRPSSRVLAAGWPTICGDCARAAS